MFVTIALYPLANRDIKILLVTLCEMIEIFYHQDEKRSPKMILCLHNLCWRHAIQCRSTLPPPKSLTYRKLFGLYFHSSVTHSAQLLRLCSHRSTNAEMFERLFEKISSITKKTWNRQLEDLPRNAILHIKQDHSKCVIKEEREISKLAKSLPKMGNTFILKSDLQKYAKDWEVHLKLIADFLMPGEGVWWRDIGDGIEFFDGTEEQNFREEGPRMHHFRSSTISQEQKDLETIWKTCKDEKVKLPATLLTNTEGRLTNSEHCCPVTSQAEFEEDLTTDQISQEIDKQQPEDDSDDPQPSIAEDDENIILDEQLNDGCMAIDIEDGNTVDYISTSTDLTYRKNKISRHLYVKGVNMA